MDHVEGGQRRASRRQLLRASLSLLVGAGAAAAASKRHAARSPGRALLWVADRAGHAVAGLGTDAVEVFRVPVRAPVSVTAIEGGCLVEYMPRGYGPGPTRWLRIDADGLVEPAPIGPSRRRRDLVRAQACRDGARSGEWRLGELDDPLAADLTGPSSRFLERWVAARSGRDTRAFRFQLPWTARALVADHHGVWVAADRRCALWRVSHTGVVRLRVEFQDADGVEALAADGYGGVFAACGGALVRVDALGRRLPGQGGFCHVVDLALALG